VNTQPFTVDLPLMTLDDLLQQLADTRGPEELDGSRHEPWVPLGAGGLVADRVRLARPEAAINRFAHNRATVDG
jgi:hypothetical protein